MPFPRPGTWTAWTDEPFYNFPYTFGYLFSVGIYARAVEEGPAFEPKYLNLLRDTGRMTVEEQAALALVGADVAEFLHLTESGPAGKDGSLWQPR